MYHILPQAPEPESSLPTLSSKTSASVFVDHDAEQRASVLQKIGQLKSTLDSIQNLFNAGSQSADAVKSVFYRNSPKTYFDYSGDLNTGQV